MTLQHPFDKLSAVVDGELDHDSRDRVLSHLVGCDSCRAKVEAERQLRTRLGALSCYTPEPSTDLTQRLLGVPSYSLEAREEVRPVLTPVVSLSPQRSAFPAARTGGSRPGARTTRSRRRRTGVLGAAGSAAAVASLLGTAFVIGDPARQEQPPLLQPPVSSFSADHAGTTTSTPFVADPVAMLTSFNGAGYSALSPTLQPVALAGR